MFINQYLRKRANLARRTLHEMAGSDRYSRMSLHNIEERLIRLFGDRPGTFIEAGANDGISQSNTYWLEKIKGWRGILIEPIPVVAAQCRRNRPKASVVNAALVSTSEIKSIKIAAVGLYGYVTGSLSNPEHEVEHRRRGASTAGIASVEQIQDIEVPARTLESVLDEAGVGPIDFFSLDVEGYEINVLRGMNMRRYRPAYLLVEAQGPKHLLEEFGEHYDFLEQMTENDVLLKAKSPSTA